jgi:hypothetical protein
VDCGTVSQLQSKSCRSRLTNTGLSEIRSSLYAEAAVEKHGIIDGVFNNDIIGSGVTGRPAIDTSAHIQKTRQKWEREPGGGLRESAVPAAQNSDLLESGWMRKGAARRRWLTRCDDLNPVREALQRCSLDEPSQPLARVETSEKSLRTDHSDLEELP